MVWKKAPTDLIEIFSAALPEDEGVERRKMFGYPCAFVNGNMFAGLHEHNLFVRLAEEQRAELLRQPGAVPFEPLPRRVMREYVVVPRAMLTQTEALRTWVARAFHHAAKLAPRSSTRPRRSAKS